MASPRNEGATIAELDSRSQPESEVSFPRVVLSRGYGGRSPGRPPSLHAEVVASRHTERAEAFLVDSDGYYS
jgi:hypothetical protein